MLKIISFRCRSFIKRWFSLTLKDCFSPFSLFSLIGSIVTATIAVQKGGEQALKEQITLATDGLHILFVTMCIFVPFSLLASLIKTINERRDLGQWRENRYTYNEPRLIKTVVVLPADSGKYIDIDFPGVPSDAMIGYKIEYHGGLGKVQVGGVFSNMWDWIDRTNQSGSFRKVKSSKILVNCPSNSVTTTARIYQTYWELA